MQNTMRDNKYCRVYRNLRFLIVHISHDMKVAENILRQYKVRIESFGLFYKNTRIGNHHYQKAFISELICGSSKIL